MARTPYDQTDGQAGTAAEAGAQIIQAVGQDMIALPGADFVKNAELQRDGQDLVLEGPDGQTIIVKDYFSAEPAPMLQADTGETLTPGLVQSFVKQSGPARYAEVSSADDASPVGIVHEAGGRATVTRSDGTTEEVRIGTRIFEGDIVETSGEGAINITFVDGSTFAVSQNAKLAIDEYVFDPASESGSSDFSILRGLFVFTSGLIGRDDPDDVTIDTPMGSIGIRGTIIAGNVDTGEITVLEGAIVLRSFNGDELTLAEQYETARFDAAGGDIVYLGKTTAESFDSSFSSIRTVTPALFTGLDSATPQPQANEQAPASDDAAPEPSLSPPPSESNIAPEAGEAPATGTEPVMQTEPQPAPQESQLPPPPVNDPYFSNPLEPVFTETAGTGTTSTTTLASGTMTAPPPGGTTLSGPAPVGTATTAPSDSTVLPPPNTTTTTTTTAPPPSNPSHIFLGDIIANGVTANGRFIAGSGGLRLGDYVAPAGDFNNDGRADFFASEYQAVNGETFVYTGTGAEISGGGVTSAGSPSTNLTAAGLGDINGDGQSDFIHGSPDAGAGYNGNAQMFISGQAPVSFSGQDNNLSDGTRGTVSTDMGDLLGESVAGIGDINGDGFADTLIGAPGRDFGSQDDAGAAYVILGASTISGPINVDAWGFTLNGSTTGDLYGDQVSGAGDLDNDGFTDFAVSRPGQGTVDIYFGDVNNANIISSRKTITGINADPAEKDIPVMNMGDMNGDGITDIAVASTNGAGAVHIFSGSSIAGAGATINVTSAMKTFTPGTSTFEIIGGGAAGDFNGDGYDDGVLVYQDGTKLEMFVVYGNASAGTTGMTSLTDPARAFHMSMDLANYNVANLADFNVEVANPGDLNGDGFDDIVLGMGDLHNSDGGVFVINGRNAGAIGADGQQVHIAGQTTAMADVIANANGQHLVGSAGNNILDQNGMADVSFRGGAGNDLIRLSNADIRTIDGGGGHDRLEFSSGAALDFSNVGSEALAGIEEFAMMGSNQTLTLGIDDIFRLLQESDSNGLTISANGDTTNRLVIDSNGNTFMAPGNIANAAYLQTELGDVHGGTAVSHTTSGAYDVFSFGGYTLAVESVLLDGANPSQIV